MALGVGRVCLTEDLAGAQDIIMDLCNHRLTPRVVLLKARKRLRSLLPMITTPTPGTRAMS
jgi:hypothetical protein